MDRYTLKWERIAEDGNEANLVPVAYDQDAGLDLPVSARWVVYSMSQARIPCGIRVSLPYGIAALVVGRSSTVARGLLVFPTLIDPGYRGDLFIFVLNLTRDIVHINAGDRLAQLVPIHSLGYLMDLERVPLLPPSERGARGFGSSGGNHGG